MRLRNAFRTERINAAFFASNLAIKPASCCSFDALVFEAAFLPLFMLAHPPFLLVKKMASIRPVGASTF
jgi:hypothetical protein